MWQDHHETTLSQPLFLTAGDERVDRYLSTVEEIAKLGFPEHQAVGTPIDIPYSNPSTANSDNGLLAT